MDIEKIISEMTLEEKARMVSGFDFWWTEEFPELGVPAVQVSDGPHGLRKMYRIAEGVPDGTITSVCFPAACAAAASFDENMMEEMGHVLGKECQAEKVAVLLGPAVNIKRSPLCGRNFEFFSEDPLVSGVTAAAVVKGLADGGVNARIMVYLNPAEEVTRP